jgi:hypothetical protein
MGFTGVNTVMAVALPSTLATSTLPIGCHCHTGDPIRQGEGASRAGVRSLRHVSPSLTRHAAWLHAVEVAKLIYSAIASLDGYIEEATGDFEWAAPDAEVHAFVNELVIVGSGKRALPGGVYVALELLDERRFAAASSISTTGSAVDLPDR